MLIIKNVVENVIQFSAGKYLVYKDKQKNVYCNDNQIYAKVDDDLIQYEDKLFFNFENNLKVFNLIDDTITTIQDIAIIDASPKCIEKGILIDENNNLYLFDKITFNKTKLLFNDYDWGFLYIYDNLISISMKKGIILYSSQKSTIIWQYDLSGLGTYQFRSEDKRPYEVKKFIGVINNVLWVEVSNCTLLALDIETGKLIRRISCLSLVSDNIRTSDGSSNFILDEKNKRIVWLAWVSLFHIDIENGDIQLIKYFWDDNKNNRWEFGRRTLAEDKIYFVGKKAQEDFYFNKRVGVMDVNTGEILWHEYLEDSGGLDAPQICGDKLYVLGTGSHVSGTSSKLYIFEKEKCEN